MSTFINLPSSLKYSHGTTKSHHLQPLSRSPSFSIRLHKYDGRLVVLRVKCLNEQSRDVVESGSTNSPLSSSSSGISPYTWSAAIGGLGFLETSYLSYSKLTRSDAFCPVGGGSCTYILNINYALVYGVPLPLIGVVAYGAATYLALKLAAKDLPFGIDETTGGLILLGTTTSMATASAYFLYILNTQFPGPSCSYYLMSVMLSFSLFFLSAKKQDGMTVSDKSKSRGWLTKSLKMLGL